jgi:type II secretion system protein H
MAPSSQAAQRVGPDRVGRAGAAYTLIEVMVVLAILAIVMTISVPSLMSLRRKEPLRQAVSDLVEGFSHARAQAILGGVPMETVLRASDGLITVMPAAHRAPAAASPLTPAAREEPAAAPDTPRSKIFTARLHEDIAIIRLSVNLQDQMQAAEARARFYPNGTSDECTIELESKAGLRRLSLDSVTGTPDVEVLR